MKIGINLLQFSSVQGTEIFAQNLLLNLIKLSPQKIFLFVSENTPKILRIPNSKIVVIKNMKGKYLNTIYQQIIFPFLLKKYKIDLLFSPSPGAPIMWFKKIVTIHDCAYDRYPEFENLISRMFFKVLYFSAKYFAKKIITVSEFSKKELIELYKIKAEKIEVVLEAAPELPKVSKEFQDKVLRKFNLQEPYFIYVGNWRPRKNLFGLIQAFQEFLLFKPNFRLVIVGRKDKRFFDLEKEIEKKKLKNNIILTDFVSQEEKTALYQRSIALVFPSFYEGFGLPVLEAQSLGVPVITSNTSALPETAGEGALLVNPYNIEEIKEAMIKIVEDQKLRQNLIQKGYQNIQRFSWEKSAKKLLQIFDEAGN